MRVLLFAFLLLIGFSAQGQSLYQKKIRSLFTKVHYDEKYNSELWELTKSTNIDNPTIYAYKCLYYIMNAKYVFWVHKKMENFKTGRTKLDLAIEKYPMNADLRLVRYAVQKNAPKFLKYSENTEEDKKILLEYKKNQSTDQELVSLIDGVLAKFP
ncbi:MAG: hypothetical protein KDC84_04615 [Crocinitomicaceae bacterium]|nr:hypothetical protein [Crocinitomicaceae bacterium]